MGLQYIFTFIKKIFNTNPVYIYHKAYFKTKLLTRKHQCDFHIFKTSLHTFLEPISMTNISLPISHLFTSIVNLDYIYTTNSFLY